MNAIRIVAVLLLVLGLLVFVVPVPHHEDHSVRVGGAKLGVETEHSEKLPPAVGVVLLAGGVLAWFWERAERSPESWVKEIGSIRKRLEFQYLILRLQDRGEKPYSLNWI
jgi:hypothetical protein